MKKIVCILVVVVIAFLVLVYVAPVPVTDVDLNTVRAELMLNEYATQEKYEYRRYNVENWGRVDQIYEDYIVVLIPNNIGATSIYVQLRYKNSEREFVRQLVKGNYVKFEGLLNELRTGGLWMYFQDVVFTEKSYAIN